jgi:hypothetical protein
MLRTFENYSKSLLELFLWELRMEAPTLLLTSYAGRLLHTATLRLQSRILYYHYQSRLPLELPLSLLTPNLNLIAGKQKGGIRKQALTGAEAPDHQ